jgi:DNA mismatch repair protein MutS2
LKLFPESASVQLEFEKIRQIVVEYCSTELGKQLAVDLRLHTKREYIELELRQSYEYLLLIRTAMFFPNDYILNINRELKLLGIQGAVLREDDFMQIRKLSEGIQKIFRWFDAEKITSFSALHKVIIESHYEKSIMTSIDHIFDESGQVKDNASEDLQRIRMSLYRKRTELRRMFDRIIQKLSKAGYMADIDESFLNGRRVVAVQAEYKRQVKGILHGESDTRRTTFIEPEETIELNNDIFSLESDEQKEIIRILRDLTQRLSVYAPLLVQWHSILGNYDFIRAKAKLAADTNATLPNLSDRSGVHLVKAFHPLLYLYNRRQGKVTMPVNVTLNEKQRMLVISGPNAGGKTVTLKTVGLLQLMVQSGLLVPVDPGSEFGIFKQLMIHIGDTQSLEFELSTYSSHLKNMKYFMENASGRTLFFIDELGSGSDPNLGGAFAEVILEELLRKHAYGIVTTHYLNLKVMAGKTSGIINGAMAFDEQNLLPLYQLTIGKPGSSYTFSIAERIGLEKRIIERARKLVDDDHFSLDKLLNRTEQDLRKIEEKESDLQKLLKSNERLKKQMETELNKEKHRMQVEILQQQNKISEERILYLKDMERKLKQIVMDWRKAESQEDKRDLMKLLQGILFKQKEKQVTEKVKRKFNAKYIETGGLVAIGELALMKQNNQVGTVKEIRGKKAIVQLGAIPITVELSDLIAVQLREEENN